MDQDLLKSIAAYVPGFVLRRLAYAPQQPLRDWEERREAVLLFADVSGFTAMSETLAQLGKEGAEELTRTLNLYFRTMIDLVRHYGGQVGKFGGDAMTCAFENGPAGILRACACAQAMQKEMAGFDAVETRGGTFALQMKIGISAGPVLFLNVGDREQGMEYVLAGRPLDRMAEAEHHARAGEVVLDGACLPAGTDWAELGIEVAEERQGFLLIKGLTSEAPADRRASALEALATETSPGVTEQLIPFLPPAVFQQIEGGQRQFVGEHRRVVSLFVNFTGLDYDDDPTAGSKLRQYFAAMQEIIHRYGGRLNRVATGDKGSLLHLIFGAPVAHEDNEERAIGCALEMQQRTLQQGELSFITHQRIGIASGYVFAGNVGSERRREYTVMGDVVNLSARLMQAAGKGEILTDEPTARQASGEFVCQELPPIHVKGKSEPVPVCRAVGAREETKVWSSAKTRQRRSASPIVGREQELAQLREIIDRAAAGHGQLLAINGEAGVGKSRLLEELVALAQDRGVYGLGGDCLSYGSQSPYLPWIDFFNSFFGLKTEGQILDEKAERIEQKMAEVDPGLVSWAPLMGQLLGLPLPDNELTAALDAQLRKQRTLELALTLLRHQARQVSLFLIVLEDVHWIDAASLEMLNYVARNIARQRVLLVAIHRPTIELTEWRRHEHYNQIDLVDLSAADALKLIEIKLGMSEVPQQLRERILRGEERVNPFFVEEMINSLVDRDYLAPRTEGAGYELVGDLAQVELPDSIQALVMSRIDRLDESSKLTVKVAAVIGRTFKYRTLEGIYPIEIAPAKLRENLNELSRIDLTPLDRPAPEWEYIFKHITTQEVAYESLLYAHRRELHHSMGAYLERTYPEGLAEHYELLAHHYFQSGDQDKSWAYLVGAGDKAKQRYANEAAIVHYKQALSLEEQKEDIYLVYESLGDVHRLIGEYDQALGSYRSALDHGPAAPAQVAEIERKTAKTWELQGQYDEAIKHLDLAIAALGDARETPQMARIHSDMAWVHMRRGSYEEALQLCTTGLELIAQAPADEAGIGVKAELLHTLGTVHLQLGQFEPALEHFRTCIETRESIADLYGMSRTYNNMAAVYWGQGDYERAAEHINQSLEIHLKIGNTYGTAMCYSNLGAIHYAQGGHKRASDYYERGLAIREEIGDLQGIAELYNNLGEVQHALGDLRRARDYLRGAIAISNDIGDRMSAMDAHRSLAEVELELGETDQALQHGQRSLELAQEVGSKEYEAGANRTLGMIHRAADRLDQAQEQLEQSVGLLEDGNRLELGRSLYELGLTLAAMEQEQGQERLREAAEIFEQLGAAGDLAKARQAFGD